VRDLWITSAKTWDDPGPKAAIWLYPAMRWRPFWGGAAKAFTRQRASVSLLAASISHYSTAEIDWRFINAS